MVKSALDAFCVRSGVLCARCEELVESGKVSKLDLNVIRKLQELEKEFPSIQDVQLFKATRVKDTLVILADKRGAARLTSQEGKIIKALSEAFRSKVKVLAHEEDEKRFLEELLWPLPILTINKVWIPDGTTEIKAVVAGSGRRALKLPMDLAIVKELAKELRGISLRIEFERP